MKSKKFSKSNYLSLTFIILNLATTAQAASSARYYNPSFQRGEVLAHFTSPTGYQEQCVVPKPFPGFQFSEKELKKHKDLCEIDFYENEANANMAVCPKIYSTSPGLEVFLFNAEIASSRQAFEAKYCSQAKDKPAKKIAKYKQSLTCTYTPSLLAYYQVAKILGDVLHIPPAVIRTVDKKQHLLQVKRAQEIVEAKYSNPKTIIRYAWETNWSDIHNNPEGSNAKSFPNAVQAPWLFTTDYQGIYGALSENPTNEYSYTEISGKYSYDTRYQSLKAQTPYRNVSRTELTKNFVPLDFTQSAPILIQMKDVSDMILMDTLLNQQDRVGNIAYLSYAYYLVDGQIRKMKLKETKLSPETISKIQALRGTNISLVKEMLLKDNDCGVAKSNMARINSLLEDVHHMSFTTYQRLLWLANAVDTPEVESYFKNELLFNDQDWDGKMKFKQNVEFAAQHLQSKCLSGELYFDLNLQQHIDGTTPSDFTKLCELNAEMK